MVRFQGRGVGGAEGGGEFGIGVLERVTESLGCEIEASDEPEESFGCGVFFCFELGEDEGLEGGGVGGGGELAVADFLDVGNAGGISFEKRGEQVVR